MSNCFHCQSVNTVINESIWIHGKLRNYPGNTIKVKTHQCKSNSTETTFTDACGVNYCASVLMRFALKAHGGMQRNEDGTNSFFSHTSCGGMGTKEKRKMCRSIQTLHSCINFIDQASLISIQALNFLRLKIFIRGGLSASKVDSVENVRRTTLNISQTSKQCQSFLKKTP